MGDTGCHGNTSRLCKATVIGLYCRTVNPTVYTVQTWYCTAHSTSCTAHSTSRAAHSTLHTAHHTLHTAHHTLHAVVSSVTAQSMQWCKVLHYYYWSSTCSTGLCSCWSTTIAVLAVPGLYRYTGVTSFNLGQSDGQNTGQGGLDTLHSTL